MAWATSLGSLDRYLAIPGHETPLRRPYPNMQGFQVQVSPGERKGLLRVEGLSEALARIDPTLITLHLSAAPLPNVDAIPPGTNSRTQAEIRWGCGGGTHAAILDVGKGTTVQLVADAIDVEAVYRGPGTGILPIAAVGPRVLFSATAVYGARSGAQSAPTVTYTEEIVLDPVVPALGLVPPFAKSVNLLLSDAAALRTGGALVTLEAAPDLSFAPASQLVMGGTDYATRYGRPWALLPTANYLRASIAGVGAQPAWLIYELALLQGSD